jgi:hypothetical protein
MMQLTKKLLVFILLLPGFGLCAQTPQGGGEMMKDAVIETVPNAQFPFGQPLKLVKQRDRTPKKVFVLGVYTSAVHAKWLSAEGKRLCQALAVASEPEIFWNGEKRCQVTGGT